jgi:hypothetical protein
MLEQPLSPRISDDDEQDDEQKDGGYSSLDEDSSGEDEDVYDLFTQVYYNYICFSAHIYQYSTVQHLYKLQHYICI